MSAGKRLRTIREQTGFSQKIFSEKTGIPYRRVQNLENEHLKRFKPEEIEALAGLGYHKMWLLTGEGKMLSAPEKAAYTFTRLNEDDLKMIEIIICQLEKKLASLHKTITPENKAKVIVQLYAYYKESWKNVVNIADYLNKNVDFALKLVE